MTKEQEKAIERLQKAQKDIWYAILYSQEEKDKDIKTVLNLIQEKDTKIQEQQEEIEKKDKIIGLIAETIMIDTGKLGTFWCNGCSETARCKYNNNIIACIKQYFERKVADGRDTSTENM